MSVRGYKPWTGQDIARLQSLLKAGYLHIEIAERLGRHPGSVSNRISALRKEGVIVKGRNFKAGKKMPVYEYDKSCIDSGYF
jgi:predicted transcriptional regulator